MKRKCDLLLLSLTLLGLVFIGSCGEIEHRYPTYYLDNETKDYCLFKEGSWWVYIGNENEITDSMYCSYDSVFIQEADRYDDANIETMSLNFVSTFYNDDFKFNNLTCPLKESDEVIQGIINYSVKSGFFMPLIYFNPHRTNSFNCGQSGFGIVHVGDYDELAGFQNVREFDSIHNLSVLPKTIYWAKNVGIIKKVMPDGTEWTLKNYHVIQ